MIWIIHNEAGNQSEIVGKGETFDAAYLQMLAELSAKTPEYRAAINEKRYELREGVMIDIEVADGRSDMMWATSNLGAYVTIYSVKALSMMVLDRRVPKSTIAAMFRNDFDDQCRISTWIQSFRDIDGMSSVSEDVRMKLAESIAHMLKGLRL